jgi:SAM-dependent methyltransferase
VNPTQRFSGRAADYAAGRPSYPIAAVEALFDGLGDAAALTVADLGAGTGISARMLAAVAAHVIAVEPNDDMRESDAASGPKLTWLAATAERAGLESRSVDVVTAFQAFHWFDPEMALREMERMLRSPGRAALVYNQRDERDAFTREYDVIVSRYASNAKDTSSRRRESGLAAFRAYPAWRNVRTLEFENPQTVTKHSLRARARSASYAPKEGEDAKALLAQLDDLFQRHERGGVASMRMRTIVTLAEYRI